MQEIDIPDDVIFAVYIKIYILNGGGWGSRGRYSKRRCRFWLGNYAVRSALVFTILFFRILIFADLFEQFLS
jgi:hypothetical protein